MAKNNENTILTNKQQLFIKEYLIDLNATQAAIRAGYSKKTAKIQASQNLTKLNIQEALKKEIENKFNKADLESEQIINECKKIGFADIKDLLRFDKNGVEFKNSDEVDGTLISEVSSETTEIGFDEKSGNSQTKTKMRLKTWDKLKALEILARYKSLFKEALDISGEININVHKYI